MLPVGLKKVAFNLLEFFLPRLCVFCGDAVGPEAQVAVCGACELKLEPVASPLCPCCGVVFGAREGADHLCGECTTEPPAFARARAPLVYEGPAADAIRRFKYSRRMEYLQVMQHWLMAPICRDLAAAAKLLAPVPLHPKRLKERGFNQALLLAQAFPEIPLGREVLARTRHTRPQAGLNPKERRDNVHRAFAVTRPEDVRGKSVLLLDDVYTTGATVRECARVLIKAGAREVNVLTVARVRRE